MQKRGKFQPSKNGKPNYANNAKLQGKIQLKELFPNIEQYVLDSIFDECNHDLAASVKKVSLIAGVEYNDDNGPRENLESGFKLQELVGDLFLCEDGTSLAHCVSQDLAMGKGIATLFKKKFGNVNELISQNQTIGGVAHLSFQRIHVYYLITKFHYSDKPTYGALKNSLEYLCKLCQDHGVKLLAIPRIGCGLDGLLWEKVKEIIVTVFWEVPISISVYRLE